MCAKYSPIIILNYLWSAKLYKNCEIRAIKTEKIKKEQKRRMTLGRNREHKGRGKERHTKKNSLGPMPKAIIIIVMRV